MKFMSFHASIRILSPPSFDYFARSLTLFLTMAAGEYRERRSTVRVLAPFRGMFRGIHTKWQHGARAASFYSAPAY